MNPSRPAKTDSNTTGTAIVPATMTDHATRRDERERTANQPDASTADHHTHCAGHGALNSSQPSEPPISCTVSAVPVSERQTTCAGVPCDAARSSLTATLL